jgi:hypothetical protein
VSATITTTLGRSIFSLLLLSLSTRFVNNREGTLEQVGRRVKRFR